MGGAALELLYISGSTDASNQLAGGGAALGYGLNGEAVGDNRG